ncbi:MAG: SUMF1/EgtB/PvdO family nonheme iron enzyme [Akkermansiaceae bacterium]
MLVAIFLLWLPWASESSADTFGNVGNQFNMNFAVITAGNVADDTGYGAVPSNFRMGVNEVSRQMVESYNASGGGPQISIYDLGAAIGTPNRPDMPATGISWNEAARFVNWLNVSKGHAPAYKFAGNVDANENITLWSVSDSGYDSSNKFRNSNAYYFLPSDDEWYRAAYYDPSAAQYWNYATGSDSAPTEVAGGTTPETAVYVGAGLPGPADITNAGGLSPFGVMALNGNANEWLESAGTQPNDSSTERRAYRGSDWTRQAVFADNNWRGDTLPTAEISTQGFRVASVPEPSTCLLGLLGMLGIFRRRR